MLSKLEASYLGILRVIILVVATVALLVAGAAFLSAIPPLLRQAGISSRPPISGGTLGEYVAARKATVLSATGGSALPSISPTTGEPATLTIATGIAGYLNKHRPAGAPLVAVPDVETAVTAQTQSVSPAQRGDYLTDLTKLSSQLKSSTGKPLALDDVNDLLHWHQQQFLAREDEANSARAADAGRSLLTLTVAGYAFAFFILIVFTFIFVKIERNLRGAQFAAREGDHA